MALITAEEMLEGLRQAVAQKGADYVYEYPDESYECVYVHPETGAPSCIVGYALASLRPDEWNIPSVIEVNKTAECLSDDPDLVLVTHEAALVARAAQEAQDTEKPWGVALEVAEGAYADIVRFAEGV